MKVRLISPDKEEISFDYNENAPFTFNTMKDILQNQFNFKSVLSYSFYHNKSQITRSTKFPHRNMKENDESVENNNDQKENLAAKDDNNEMVISYFSKLQFPTRSFPQTDYCFPLDFPLFLGKNADNDSSLFYPPMEGPKCIMSGNTNLTNLVEDTIEQATAFSNFFGADPILENLADSLVNDNFDMSSIRNFINNFGDDRLEHEDQNPGPTIIQRRTQFGNLVQVQQGQTTNNTTQKSNSHDNANPNDQANSYPNNQLPPNSQPPSHTPPRSTSSTNPTKPSNLVTKRKHKASSRRHLFESNAHPEEEEKGNEDAFEEYDDEEEDLAEGIDEIMEMKENYEESMTPEIEQSVERLTQLGFDRNLVTPLLFMLGDEEKTMNFLQKTFDAMQS